jgi:hypothetical protein
MADLSQISISRLISENDLLNNQWLTSSKNLADRNLRQIPPEDFRALTPLTYAHVNPYGKFELDMQQRLHLEAA